MDNMKSHYINDQSSDMYDDEDELDNIMGSPTQSCQVPDRKRRRGIIEKKRRDRINHSLAELKRLVPAAFEKQGSTKLEKAEILKMTVDHLKMLQAKAGGNTYGLDTTAVAMDFRSIGFRECAAEVARYLASNEGLDSHDPLRVRLLSHLQYYASHARTSNQSTSLPGPSKSSSGGGAWGYSSQHHSGPSQYSTLVAPYSLNSHKQSAEQQLSSLSAFTEPSSCGAGSGFFPPSAAADDKLMTAGYRLPGLRFQSSTGSTESNFSQVIGGGSSQGGSSYLSGLNGSFLGHGNQISSGLNDGGYMGAGAAPSASSLLLQCVKPYRPWGADSFMTSLMSGY